MLGGRNRDNEDGEEYGTDDTGNQTLDSFNAGVGVDTESKNAEDAENEELHFKTKEKNYFQNCELFDL